VSNSSSSSVPAKAVSWHEAVATHPTLNQESKSPPAEPIVAKIMVEVEERGIDSVIASLLNAQMPKGELSPFEKELAAALREIGTKGVSSAIQQADKMVNS